MTRIIRLLPKVRRWQGEPSRTRIDRLNQFPAFLQTEGRGRGTGDPDSAGQRPAPPLVAADAALGNVQLAACRPPSPMSGASVHRAGRDRLYAGARPRRGEQRQGHRPGCGTSVCACTSAVVLPGWASSWSISALSGRGRYAAWPEDLTPSAANPMFCRADSVGVSRLRKNQ